MSVRHLPLANSNRLFSSFDVEHEDKVDLRELVACLRVLRRPREDIADKIVSMMRYYSDFSAERPASRADTLSCLQLLAKDHSSRMTLEHIMADALVENLGSKSVWARDVTPESLTSTMYYSSALTAELRRIVAAVTKRR